MKYFSLFMVILCMACGYNRKQNENGDKTVVVSILPQKYLADRIVGDNMNVVCLVPSGASPETYALAPSDMEALSRASLYFPIGNMGFEMSRIDAINDLNENLKVIKPDTEILWLDDGHHHCLNPHIWMSPKNLIALSRLMFNEIAKEDMLHFAEYERNYQQLQYELQQLDYEINRDLKELTSRVFLIYHPALTYYASDYNLTEIAIEQHGKKPSVKQLKSLLEKATTDTIKTVFIQKQFDMDLAKSIAEELNADVIQIDPLDYQIIDQLKSITIKMKQSLN